MALLLAHGCGVPPQPELKDFILTGDDANAMLCRPKGQGPFPAVVYSLGRITDFEAFQKARGRLGDRICRSLASEGYLTFIPVREFQRGFGPENIPYNLAELSQAVDYVKTLPDVDLSRVAVMGQSRGGLLTLMLALQRKDLKTIVITAPADIRPYFSSAVARVASLNAPVLLLVEVSDEEGGLGAVNVLDNALRNHGKEVRTIRYDRGGGHYLFTSLSKVDWYWWNDVSVFLREKLR